MKKALAILMTLALVASAATAEITWGAWGRGVFVAAQSDGTDTTAVTEASWGGNPRIGFGINGSSDNMGFHVDLTGDVASVGIGDNAKIWWKGNDMFKLEIGKVQFDALRGKIGDQSFARYIAGFNYGEDQLFTRFYPQCGAVVELTPVEGAVIAASVDPSSTATKAETVYQKIQIGAGYTIAGVGQVRAQYIGNTGDLTYDATAYTASASAARIEAAFAYTGVEGLTLDIGGKYYLPVSKTESGLTVTVAKPINASVGANFKKDAFGLFARVDAAFAGSTSFSASGTGYSISATESSPLNISVYAIPSYALDFATIGCDIAYGMTGDTTATATVTLLGASSSATATTKGSSTLGFCPYIEKGNSNGKIKAGFAVQAPMNSGDKLKWAVPVLLEYWF